MSHINYTSINIYKKSKTKKVKKNKNCVNLLNYGKNQLDEQILTSELLCVNHW